VAVQVASGSLPFLGSLARSERRGDRLLWLRVATDYFLVGEFADPKLSGEFLIQFADCLDSVDERERFAVARRLLSRPGVSPRLLNMFVEFGGEAATFVLTHARGLGREALFSAASDPKRARAIAHRDDLDDGLVTAILASDDAEAILALAGNLLAPLSGAQIRELSNRARRGIAEPAGRRLADRLLARTPARVEAAALFLEASPAQRTSILIAAQRLELGRPRAAQTGSASREAIERLEASALAGEIEQFSVILSEILGCPLDLAQRIADDRDGEPLAVTLAAIGAPNDVSVRILTAADLRDGADYPRVGALARLRDVLSPIAARGVIEAIVGHDLLGDAPSTERNPRTATPSDRRARLPAISSPPVIRDELPSPLASRRPAAFATNHGQGARG
jgi:hypothetical protein